MGKMDFNLVDLLVGFELRFSLQIPCIIHFLQIGQLNLDHLFTLIQKIKESLGQEICSLMFLPKFEMTVECMLIY